MRRVVYGIAVLAALTLMGAQAQDYYMSVTYGYPFELVWNQPKAEFWDPAIVTFEEADMEAPPASGQVLFVGSSSFAFWETMEADMAPLSVLNRGFGGSNLDHLTYYADRVIVPYAPRAIVVFAGGNNFRGFFPDDASQVVAHFNALVAYLGEKLPGTPVYYVSIKPTIGDWEKWPEVRTANRLIREATDEEPRLQYIDISLAMMGSDHRPRPELFVEDGIHLSAEGYRLWTSIIKPRLIGDTGESHE